MKWVILEMLNIETYY